MGQSVTCTHISFVSRREGQSLRNGDCNLVQIFFYVMISLITLASIHCPFHFYRSRLECYQLLKSPFLITLKKIILYLDLLEYNKAVFLRRPIKSHLPVNQGH